MQQYKIHERNIGINLTLLYPQLHPNTSRAECECSDDYEGPSCQLDKSSIPPSVNPPSPAPPPTNDRSIQLGLWPIVGISLAGLCVILLIIFFLTSGGTL